METHKAKYVCTDPIYSAPPIEREFPGRDNAERWLLSFGLGKFGEHYINGENVTETLKARRVAIIGVAR